METQFEQFNTHRPRLFAIAYRMLGTRADAEDVLQDVYLRWHGSDPKDPQRKIPRALHFEALRVIPDQMYADVDEVDGFDPERIDEAVAEIVGDVDLVGEYPGAAAVDDLDIAAGDEPRGVPVVGDPVLQHPQVVDASTLQVDRTAERRRIDAHARSLLERDAARAKPSRRRSPFLSMIDSQSGSS